MEFHITGRVYEQESGLGVEGLMIRAYDRDLLFDDLLGTAISDTRGEFEMLYSQQDFSELFESKPDIYLAVYGQPCRFLLDTKDTVRWGASDNEHFDIVIDRELLGPQAPTLPDDQVASTVAVTTDDLRIEQRDGFSVPKLPRFTNGGPPGAPALPEQTQYVALPLGGDVLSLEVETGEPVRLPATVVPLPVQDETPDLGTDPEQFGDGFSADTMPVTLTVPDPEFYQSKNVYPQSLVELKSVDNIGPIQVASVRMRPLQYDPVENNYLFYPKLKFRIQYDLEKARHIAESGDTKKRTIGIAYSEYVQSLMQSDLFATAKHLFWPQLIPEDYLYLIITDNYAWPDAIDRGDGTTRAPNLEERGAALDGELITQFERLAHWKTTRGVRTRVFTISNIVDGRYGDFTENGFARDLQEVIRNFIKHAHETWDTLYVLLGGDVDVVPMRRLAGCSTYGSVGCSRSGDNPPPDGRCHVLTERSIVKLHPKFTPASSDPLSTMHGGVRIAFEREAGPGRLGWYYTTEADFTTRDEGFSRLPDGQTSRFIIVEGPVDIIDDHYYWLRDVNKIPSDFYYSSLVGPRYSIPGKHDFDDNNNEIYGQYHWDDNAGEEVSLDGVDFWPDVWVGRASAGNGDQAAGFVDKIITYESLQATDDETAVDSSYLQKIIYASAYWGRQNQYRQADTSQPPEEGRFTHEAGSTTTKIHTAFDVTLSGGVLSHRLVARGTDADIVIPYNTSANASNLGWHCCSDDNYNTVSATATRFIRVRGAEDDINPGDLFFWDPVGLELAAQEKENLRGMMNGWYPNFTSVQRHYEDYFDLATPPPLVALQSDVLRDALDAGAHFVSLTGHGSWGGCCGINISSRPDFANSNQYFIAFADSCSTARPDGHDSTAEVSTLDPNGGAVAYVGNTRYSWIGVGDNYEQFFWGKMRLYRRAGPAAGLRLATGGVRTVWTLYAQTFFGDPEMPVWTDVPKTQAVSHPEVVNWGDTINITVRRLGTPVAGHQVTLLGGWSDSSTRPRVFASKTSNAYGQTSFNLPASGDALPELTVCVTAANVKPYIGRIDVSAGAYNHLE